jgi:hypothetical protein
MRRKICASFAAVCIAVLALGWFSPARAQSVPSDVSGVVYYQTQTYDNTVKLINPTTQPVASGGFLCAMVYVFDQHEELQECCGCPVTNDGLRTISARGDLTANPLTGVVPIHGGIEVVSTLYNTTSSGTGQNGCNPALSYTPTPTLKGYITHSGGNFAAPGAAEVHFKDAHVGTTEVSNLQSLCASIHTNGTGRGICTCGTGDNVAAQAGAGRR